MKRISLLLALFFTVGMAAHAGEPIYSINKDTLRTTGYFNYPVKVVADAVQKVLIEDGMQPESRGQYSIHIVAGDVTGPNVTPKYPDLTTGTTAIRYAIFVNPSNDGSSAQIALLLKSPSVEKGKVRSFDVALDHPDIVVEIEKNLLDRVAKRLEAVKTTE